MKGTMESIGMIGSITDLSKYPIMWLITEYGRAIAKIKVRIVYQNNRRFSFSRQCGCHSFHGRMNMQRRKVLSIHAIGSIVNFRINLASHLVLFFIAVNSFLSCLLLEHFLDDFWSKCAMLGCQFHNLFL